MSNLIFLPMISLPRPFWADTKLWIPFDGNGSADISGYANGSGTNTGATISGNQLVVSGSTLQHIDYAAASCLGKVAGDPFTLECFATYTSSDNASSPCSFITYTLGSTNTYRLHLYSNGGGVKLDIGGVSSSVSSSVLAVGTKTHLAVVRPSGSGAQTLKVYMGGTSVITQAEAGEYTNSTGTIIVGKDLGSGQAASVSIDDVRITKAALYSGTSFTPPTSPL